MALLYPSMAKFAASPNSPFAYLRSIVFITCRPLLAIAMVDSSSAHAGLSSAHAGLSSASTSASRLRVVVWLRTRLRQRLLRLVFR